MQFLELFEQLKPDEHYPIEDGHTFVFHGPYTSIHDPGVSELIAILTPYADVVEVVTPIHRHLKLIVRWLEPVTVGSVVAVQKHDPAIGYYGPRRIGTVVYIATDDPKMYLVKHDISGTVGYYSAQMEVAMLEISTPVPL